MVGMRPLIPPIGFTSNLRETPRQNAQKICPALSDARTTLAGFFSIQLKIPTSFDRLQQRHVVGILDIHPDRNAIGDT
jgi:hypothetical protein